MSKAFIGGQAVLEGVLMVFEDEYAVAVQGPEDIIVKKDSSALLRNKFLKIPFFRGIVVLLVMTYIGLTSMMYASRQSSPEDEQLSMATLLVTLGFTLLFAILIFKLFPLFVTISVIDSTYPVLFNVVDGLLRISLLVGYILLISRMTEIQRLFEYHGAEHKVINAHESGSLTLKQARKESRYNARCGTTFVVLVLLVAILVYSLTPLNLPLGQLLLLRLLFLVPIASLSYELIRYAYMHQEKNFVQVLLVPGRWVQHLTVREPNDQQLRVALAAAKALIK